MSENATSPSRLCDLISCCNTLVIVRFASGLMLRDTSSTSMPVPPPGKSPRAAAALLRPVSLASSASTISTTARATRRTSVRRAGPASSAVVASGIAGPRVRAGSGLRAMSVRPLLDQTPDVQRQRLSGCRDRRRLRPGELTGNEGQLALAATSQLAGQQLECLAFRSCVFPGFGPLDKPDRTLEGARERQPQPPLQRPQDPPEGEGRACEEKRAEHEQHGLQHGR